MRIKSLSVNNYRGFAEVATLELRPLTLVYGANSAGKSALLRAAPLLSDIFAAGGRSPLSLSSAATRGARFNDLRSRLTNSPWIEFGFGWTDAQGDIGLEFRLRNIPEHRQQLLERYSLHQSGKVELEAAWVGDEIDAKGPTNEYSLVQTNAGGARIQRGVASVNPFVPAARRFPSGREEFQPLLDRVVSAMETFASSCTWISSVRKVPARTEPMPFGSPLALGPDGAGAAQVICADKLNRGPLLQWVSAWYEQHFRRRLEVFEIPDAEQFRVVLSSLEETPVQVDLLDNGEGMAQVFPFLVALALAVHRPQGQARLVVAEQPELHLHLDAQAFIAELLCGLAAAPSPPTMLVETHSESVLVRTQLAVARGELPADKVRVYVVRQGNDGHSFADAVDFDPQGRPNSNWPRDMFSQVTSFSRELVSRRLGGLGP